MTYMDKFTFVHWNIIGLLSYLSVVPFSGVDILFSCFLTLITYFAKEVAWSAVHINLSFVLSACFQVPVLLKVHLFWSFLQLYIEVLYLVFSDQSLECFHCFTIGHCYLKDLYFFIIESLGYQFILSSFKNIIIGMKFNLYTSNSLFFISKIGFDKSLFEILINTFIFFVSFQIFCFFRGNNTSNYLLLGSLCLRFHLNKPYLLLMTSIHFQSNKPIVNNFHINSY